MTLRKKLYQVYKRFMLDHFHRVYVDQEWMKWKGYKVDWENPRDINEKIQWLLCYSDTSMWTLCSDKYNVRDYVKSKGLEDILVPLLGVWDKAEDVDFESLPDKFVIKCNHDSGSVIAVDKSKGYDPDAIRADLSSHLARRYGYRAGELFYNRIKPRIIAERYIEQDIPVLQGMPVDYKFWCFDGKVKYIQLAKRLRDINAVILLPRKKVFPRSVLKKNIINPKKNTRRIIIAYK